MRKKKEPATGWPSGNERVLEIKAEALDRSVLRTRFEVAVDLS